MDRVIEEAKYIIDTNSTIRQTAEKFGVGKSTVHTDMSRKLKTINKGLYNQVKAIMEEHWNTKHILGGQATYKKFKKK